MHYVHERRREQAEMLGVLINLNQPAHVVSWHFIQLSVPNILAIATMFLVFGLAIVLPFPGHRRRASGGSEES